MSPKETSVEGERAGLAARQRAWLAARAQPPPRPLQESGPGVAITDVNALPVREPISRRSYVILTVATDAGVSGIGEAPGGVDPVASARDVLALKPHLVGRDATAIESMRRHLRTVLPENRAELQGAVNMALLDVLGKVAKAPVYVVLGGPTRTKARALADLSAASPGASPEALVREATTMGFRAFALPLELLRAFTSRGGGGFRSGGRGFFREVRSELESLRETAPDADFVLDCGGRLTPGEASRLSRELERFHLLWLEEPTGPVDRKKFAALAAESVTPVGYGRGLAGLRDVQELLRPDAVDVLRPDIARHGISSIRKAAALAETHYIAVAPSHRGGPVATAAALQLAASLPNFFIQELPVSSDPRDAGMRRELLAEDLEEVTDGFFSLPTKAGLGIALNGEALAKYEVKER